MSDAAALVRDTESETPAARDERVVLGGVSWEQYVALSDILGERAGVRVTYLEGALEIMTLSLPHERCKSMIARLLEMWAVVTRTPLNGYGSATFRKQAKDRGAEPDECYVLGRELDEDRMDAPPDLVIEVMWTRGGLDKFAVYGGLGVPELWLWRKGTIEVWCLRGARYERVERSELLPALDLELLATFLDRRDQTDAVIEYAELVRG
jgi:Uma2 family endonuclease